MAAQNGLLDLMKSPAAMGLLAAGFGGLAGASRNTPINNLGRAGLAGLAGYTAADSLQQKRRDQDKAAAIQAAIPTLYGEDGSFDFRKGAGLGIDPKDLKAYAEAPNAGRAKVARTMQVPGIDGRPVTIQLDEYGDQSGQGIGAYVAPTLVDTGDKKQFVTPQAGQSFDVNMSAAQRDASSRGWANVGLGGEQNQIMREQNMIMGDLKNQEKQLKIGDMQAQQAERNRALDGQRAFAETQLGVIDKALAHPGRKAATGLSGTIDPRNYVPGTNPRDFQIVLDQIRGATFLQGFQNLKGGGAITEIEGKKAEQAMARLDRAQSDEEFELALRDLRDVMQKGWERLGGGQPQPQQSAAAFDEATEAEYQAWKAQQQGGQ